MYGTNAMDDAVVGRVTMEKDRGRLDELAGRVFQLEQLIGYQDGAIVSRTLVDRETMTLTAFALDEGQRISEHSAPHDALLQVLDGTAQVSVGDDEYELQEGEAVVFPANVPHAVDAPSRFKMLLTMVR